MKRILSVLVILCAAALTIPAMANATTAAKHPKATTASSSTMSMMPGMQMHNTKTTASATHSKTSATHQKKENTRHARETHHNKKESKKG